jgi:HD-like signal output (HDOD) protein
MSANTDTTNKAAGHVTAESLVTRLENALRTNGDFPVSAQVISEISALVEDPNTTADKLSSVILKDPTLGARLLSVVNSSFYNPGKPIVTVSQAIVHLGMVQLADLCANLILMQSFIPQARSGGAFAECLRKTILTSVLTELISLQLNENTGEKRNETGYLIGFFAEMGAMLLAFYYPNIYGAAITRAKDRNMELSRSIQQLIGVTPIQIGQQVVQAMGLPEYFAEILGLTTAVRSDSTLLKTIDISAARIIRSILIAERISGLLLIERRKRDLNKAVIESCQELDIDPLTIAPALGKLPTAFREYCLSLELSFGPMPDYLGEYSESENPFKDSSPIEESSQVADAVKDIRDALKSGESKSSIFTAVMEALAWNLEFDRVLLLLTTPDGSRLTGHLCLGEVGDLNPRSVERALGPTAGPYAPDAKAVRDGAPVFIGDPLLPGGWPFAVLPIKSESGQIEGVIYADKVNAVEDELSMQMQATIAVLTDLLEHTVST